ncbi:MULTISPECIES: lipopolysaccharide biosynthesis protein [unclassified Sphingobacterium]|uniref:lipopolysaccharide biosynthesis protein n=1 Tax=unclassified Sphingobacterium TaxID=2609468 RepID=UPI0025F3073F|nr:MULTISPECIES: oligosaccharide flippase family protein [unclassified Sphingobacterium]
MILRNKLFSDTILYALGEVFPRVISLLLLPLFTAYLTTSDYGILSYTSAFVMFLYVFCTLSLNSYVLRYYFEYKTEIDKKRLIGNVFLFMALFNIGLLLIIYTTLPTIISYFSIKVPWDPYFRLAIITNFLEVFTVVPMVLFRVRQQAVYFVSLSISRVILQFVLVYYFVVVESIGLLGSYYGQLIPLCLYFFLSWGIIARNAILNINFSQIKEGLKFSLPLLPGALAYLVMSLSDRIILERHVSLAIIGVYNVAVTFSQALNVVIQSGYRALEPEIFKRFGTVDFTHFVRKTSNVFLFIVYGLAAFLAIYSKEIFYFFTSQNFHSGSNLVPYIIFGILFAAYNVLFSSLLSAEKKTSHIGLSMIAGGMVSIVINIIFISKWGVLVAIFASALAFFVMDVILFFKMTTPFALKIELKSMLLYILLVIVLERWDPSVNILNVLIKLLLFISFLVPTVYFRGVTNIFRTKSLNL